MKAIRIASRTGAPLASGRPRTGPYEERVTGPAGRRAPLRQPRSTRIESIWRGDRLSQPSPFLVWRSGSPA